jgi:hypothetical protein
MQLKECLNVMHRYDHQYLQEIKKSISGIGINVYKYIKLNLEYFLETELKILIIIEIPKKIHETVRR